MDQARRQVIKYFLAYLAMLWSNLDHAVVTAAIRQWRRRLSACVQTGGGHFEHYFSDALSICRLVD